VPRAGDAESATGRLGNATAYFASYMCPSVAVCWGKPVPEGGKVGVSSWPSDAPNRPQNHQHGKYCEHQKQESKNQHRRLTAFSNSIRPQPPLRPQARYGAA
jgi:hypothetical protein